MKVDIVARAPDAGPPTVLLLGRLETGLPKGQGLLISIWPRVVAAVPDARLLLVGRGPALEAARTARALAGAAVAHGLRDVGAGAGPVDVLDIASIRAG